MQSLSELPEDHPLRNSPLAAIGAEYRCTNGGSRWIAIREAMGIGRVSYNQLRGTWIENNEWRVVD